MERHGDCSAFTVSMRVWTAVHISAFHPFAYTCRSESPASCTAFVYLGVTVLISTAVHIQSHLCVFIPAPPTVTVRENGDRTNGGSVLHSPGSGPSRENKNFIRCVIFISGEKNYSLELFDTLGIDEPLHIKRRKIIKPGFIHSPWKSAYIRQHRIDTNWRRGELKSPKVTDS